MLLSEQEMHKFSNCDYRNDIKYMYGTDNMETRKHKERRCLVAAPVGAHLKPICLQTHTSGPVSLSQALGLFKGNSPLLVEPSDPAMASSHCTMSAC